ncbi:MAG TPA: ABC transporter permease, partial [Bryobacteraceae bacterium]|nr:ABC transporter permease [Bryobacteraceae bacterium]
MNWLSSFGQDLRYALRQLRLSPGFTAVAVLSLALGIGANTEIFQLVDAVRLRTLPVKDPHELVTIDFPPGSELAGRFTSRSARFTYAQWEEVRRNQEPFSGVLAWSAARFNLSPGGEARLAEGLYVSGDFFTVLGVTPMRGRTFTAADDTAACSNPGSVISYAFWQREFGGDEQILGRKVMIQGLPFPILGVTQPAFFGVEVGRRYDVAVPLCADPALAQDKKGRIGFRQDWWLSILARLKPGWTVQRANAYMQTIAPAVMRASLPPTYQPDVAKKYLQNKLTATEGATGVSGLRRQYERPLWLLLGTTGLVLLIACANLANLLLARASVREREVAVRQAIGASRARLVRQLLSESLLLASCGAVLGAALAQLLSRSLIAFLTTANSPLFVGIGLDARVFGFTCLVAVVTCVLFGLLPALRATQISPASAMRAGGRGTTSGRERFSLRRALVATQVALSLVLLVGALLFVRSLQNLINTDAGFHTEGIVSLSVDLRQLQYGPERLPVAYREVLQRLLSKPGVVSAAQVLITPLSGSGWNSDIGPDGARASGSGKDSLFNRVGPGYFQTMGTPL